MWGPDPLQLTARRTHALCKLFWRKDGLVGTDYVVSCCCVVMAQVCTGVCLVLYLDGVAATTGNHDCLATTIGQKLLLHRRDRKYCFFVLFA